MTKEELQTRGEAIYGEDWQSPLARKIGIDARNVRRWKAGHRPIPDWLDWAIGVLERHEDER